jgi:hypothetical protein
VNASRYRANLLAIVAKARAALAPNGTLVWATTTPVAASCSSGSAEACFGITPACVDQINAIAAEAFATMDDVVVDDLFGGVNAVCGHGFEHCPLQRWGGVLPTQTGKQFLAISVAHTVAPLLGPAWAAKAARWTEPIHD